MRKATMILTCILLGLMESNFAQDLALTRQDSLDILNKAGLKVMFMEATLNYLADPVGKSKAVIQSSSYDPGFPKRVFLDGEVSIEDDLNPEYRMSATPPHMMTVSQYLAKFREVYLTEDPNSVEFRVSKIRSMQVGPEGIVAEVFFESSFSGAYGPDSVASYASSFRLARLSVTRIADEWQCYVSEIRFATPGQMQYYIPRDYKAHMEMMKAKNEDE